MADFTCIRCEAVYIHRAHIKGWKRNYCSVECKAKHLRKLRDRRYYLKKKGEIDG